MDIFLKILQIIPSLLKVLKAVEELMPESGNGKEKLAFISDIVKRSYAGFEDIWPTLETVIGGIVVSFNTLGIFKGKNSQ